MTRVMLIAITLLAGTLYARDWTPAPALPNPSGAAVINVSNDSQLQAAVGSIASNQLIVLAPGTYNLSNSLWFNPSSTITNIGIRGSTGDPDDVQLVGAGMTNNSIHHGIWVGRVNGMLIADLTIREVYYHPAQVTADSSNVHFYNLKLIDPGEQFIKGSSGGSVGVGSDFGIVEYCYFEYTTQGTNYTNGVDVHGGEGWIIRHNYFIRINVIGGYGPCILMWNGSSDTLVEGNTFINCEQAIALGLINRTPNDHSGGIVRNNFIYRGAGTPQGVDSPDAGIMIWDSPNTKVLNNTVIQNGSYANAIEYRFDTTGAEIRNNLCDGAITDRGGGTSNNTVANNVTNAQAAWFVDASTGDLRLSASAPASVIDAAATHTDVSDDYDGNARGANPDIGASERGATPSAPAAPTSAAATALGNLEIRVSWSASGSNQDGFRLERALDQGAFTALTSVGAGVSQHTDSALTEGQLYRYRVIAFNSVGDSPASNIASATATAAAPSPPDSKPGGGGGGGCTSRNSWSFGALWLVPAGGILFARRRRAHVRYRVVGAGT